MYRISVRSQFSAAHRLMLAQGRYEPPHEHDWSVEARFAGGQLDATGVLIDFQEVQAALRSVLGRLHQADLNAAPLLSGLNPSAENVARVICDALAGVVSSGHLLESVCVEEAPGCTATYFRRPASPGSSVPHSVDDRKHGR